MRSVPTVTKSHKNKIGMYIYSEISPKGSYLHCTQQHFDHGVGLAHLCFGVENSEINISRG